MREDEGIDTLLDLDGDIYDQDGGYWIKIEARRVEPSAEIPHGVRYSLTLHAPNGKRILGYDNAHAAIPAGKFKYAGQVWAHDHKHRHARDKGELYRFQDAAQLLDDFFKDVDRTLKEAGC